MHMFCFFFCGRARPRGGPASPSLQVLMSHCPQCPFAAPRFVYWLSPPIDKLGAIACARFSSRPPLLAWSRPASTVARCPAPSVRSFASFAPQRLSLMHLSALYSRLAVTSISKLWSGNYTVPCRRCPSRVSAQFCRGQLHSSW